MSDMSRNYIDLMYFTNPSNISRMKKIEEEKVDKEEFKKYKKDIIKFTERLIDGESISSGIDVLFNNFFIKIKEHINFTKKKNVVQSQYHLMKEKEKKEYIKMDLSELNITLMKKPIHKVKNLSDFVNKKKKRKGKKIVIPKKITFE
uniref:Uncharacterized protein n=1 Tax=viral metagenome TaxID=1070528 RepID=A0A6C0F9Z1_9ZZZZ